MNIRRGILRIVLLVWGVPAVLGGITLFLETEDFDPETCTELECPEGHYAPGSLRETLARGKRTHKVNQCREVECSPATLVARGAQYREKLVEQVRGGAGMLLLWTVAVWGIYGAGVWIASGFHSGTGETR